MTTMLTAAGRQDVPFVTRGIGWTTAGGRDVLVQALSGSQWALYCAALSAAIQIVRGAPFRLLLVEAAEADEAGLIGLCRGLAALREQLSLAIVMTPHAPSASLPGWSVLDLGERREVEAA